MGRTQTHLLLSLILILAISPVVLNHPFTNRVYGSTPTPLLTIQGENYPELNITDPSLTPGTYVNFTLEASNLPSIIDGADGGIQGFDITLAYNSTVIRPERIGFNNPFCSDSDDCLFANLTRTQFFTFANQTALTAGTLRLGMVVYNQAARVSEDGVLFKIEFLVTEMGVSAVQIDSSKSTLIGFARNCGASISYSVLNSDLDNRPPWIVTASPASATVMNGGSVTITATVTRVNSDGNITFLTVNSYSFLSFLFKPRNVMLDAALGIYSFASSLQVNATSTAPAGSYMIPIIAHDANQVQGYRDYTLNYNVTVDPPAPALFSPTLHQFDTTHFQTDQPAAIFSPTVPSLPLVTNFTFSPSLSNGLSLSFAALPCGGVSPLTFNWSFGDGTNGSGLVTSHTYGMPGTYVVSLTVKDSSGSSFAASQTVTVKSPVDYTLVALVAFALVSFTIIGVYLWRKSRSGRKR